MTSLAALTDEERGRLERLLLECDDDVPMLSSLDGFLAALAILPDPPPQDHWLAEVFGPRMEWIGEGEQAKEIVGLTLRMRHEVLDALRQDPPSFEPILDEDIDGSLMGEIWAEGFMRGFNIAEAAWQPLLSSKTVMAMLAPIVALSDYELLLELKPRAKQRRRLQEQYTADLIVCACSLFQLIRKTPLELQEMDATLALEQRKENETEAQRRRMASAGRNDPCPCGSGKKFKRCCGASA